MRKRTRHPNEPRVHPERDERGIYPAHTTADGRTYNGRTNKPVYADPKEANAVKHANGPTYPGADGPSNKMLAIIQSGAVLRPAQINGIRQSIVNVVEKNIQVAERVLEGTHVWTQPQTNLFLKLLDKVAPTMTESLHKHTMQPSLGGDYSRLSLVELEAKLRDVLDEKEPEVIDVEPEATKETKEVLTDEKKAHKRIIEKKRRLRVKEHRARILETKPETILSPLTRAQDNERRRQAKQAAKGLRKRAARAAILKDLELMAQDDPKTLDPPDNPE